MKRAEIVFVLDETGSMEILRDDTIGGFNTFVDEQKKLKAEVTFSLTLFSLTDGEDTYRPRYEGVPLADVQKLDTATYRPRGMTPLLDAIGNTIDSTISRLKALPKKKRPDKVIIVVLTDGQENSSTEYTLEQVRKKITHQREKHGWEVVFLGVGIDAFDVAGAMNIAAAYTTSHVHSSRGIAQAYTAASLTVTGLVDDADASWVEKTGA